MARAVGLALAAMLHAVIIAGLARSLPADFPDPSPAIEVALVPGPISPVETPRRAQPVSAAPSAKPERLDSEPVGVAGQPSPFAGDVVEDAGAKYRLLAAAFNACPALFVQNRLYRPGASDALCQDPRDAQPSPGDPPSPRRYALDGEPRIVFGDKDSRLPASAMRIALKPAP